MFESVKAMTSGMERIACIHVKRLSTVKTIPNQTHFEVSPERPSHGRMLGSPPSARRRVS